MTIDLRYFLPVVAFYAPALLMLIGAWALGYSTQDVREVVAGVGGLLGFALSSFAAIVAYEMDPMPVKIWRKNDNA